MNHGPYIYNAAGIALNGVNARDYPLQRDYHFATDDHDPKVDFTQYVYNEFGFDENGLDCYGRDESGHDIYAILGLDASEFNEHGYDKEGFDAFGRNRRGETREECAKRADEEKRQAEKKWPKEKRKKISVRGRVSLELLGLGDIKYLDELEQFACNIACPLSK